MDTQEPQHSEEERTASDREVADFFIKHIDNPCEVDIGEGVVKNIRDFYIREAERILPTFTDQESIDRLRGEVDKFGTNLE